MVPEQAEAETRREYINRYVLFTDWVDRVDAWVASHFDDDGLCRIAHSVAERQVELVRRITPPSEFVASHPHLLLVMENTERMLDRAATGDRSGYRRHRQIVHEEQRLMSEMLQSDGRLMPVIDP